MDNSFMIDGEILCIDKTRPAKEGSNMMLRNFIIKKPNAGETNDLVFQCKGNNTSLLDKYLPGDKVVVTFSLNGQFGGAKYKDGNPKCDTNPEGYSSFSANCNCFEIAFVQGFVRQAPQPTFNQPVPNSTGKDDFPF